MDACPFCDDPIRPGGEGVSLAFHIREKCDEIPPLPDPADAIAMTPGSTTDVGQSSDNRPSGTQGKQGNGASRSAPGDQLPPGDSTSDTLNRALSTETQDVEVTKEI